MSRYLVLAFLPLFILSSCMSVPAVGGKLRIETEYNDDKDGNTRYLQRVAAPAGTDLKGAASASRVWSADGSGEFKVGQEGSGDTTKQAEMIPLVAQISAQNAQAITGNLLSALGPILEIYTKGMVDLQMWKAQNPQPSGLSELLSGISDPQLQGWLTQLVSLTNLRPPATGTP